MARWPKASSRADGQLAVITETELYAIPPKTRRAREARATQIDNLLRDLSELKPGDPVVHAQYGVGQYLGLINMDLGDGDTEFLQLEYAKGDKLYVPVANLHLISRYSGAGEGAAPCTNSAPTSGKRRAAAPCRRRATLRPNC